MGGRGIEQDGTVHIQRQTDQNHLPKAEKHKGKIMNYQERYVAHQVRKSLVLRNICERHSERVFANKILPDSKWFILREAATQAPSSCDRKAIHLSKIEGRHYKNLISGLLVGGTGWIHRASAIIMLWADMAAYKSPSERDFMCYLDSGHVSQNIQLAATHLGLISCYCNPNCPFPTILRTEFAPTDVDDPRFCGAVAVGYSE